MIGTRAAHFAVFLALCVLLRDVAGFARLPTFVANPSLARVSLAAPSTCTSRFINGGRVTRVVMLPARRAHCGGGVQGLSATLPVVSPCGLLPFISLGIGVYMNCSAVQTVLVQGTVVV